jgi:arylsulfatase A-like enzyme
MSPPQPAPAVSAAPISAASAPRARMRLEVTPEGSVIVEPDMGRGDLREGWGARSIRGEGPPSRRSSDAGKALFAGARASRKSARALRCGVVLLLLAAAGCGGSGTRKAPPDRVVLVTIDTLRADRVGCYGDARARTRSLDTLAAQGVRFENAISPAPLTLPAHASLLTALDPPHHSVRHNTIHRLPDAVPTVAEALHQRGYATAAFVGAVVLDRRFGLARGFDVYDDRPMGHAGGGGQTQGYAERPADRVVDAALRWLETAPPRFFLWLHLYDPHAGYTPPAGFASAFASDPYRGEIAFADFQVGRLLEAVRARFGESGLLVVATSDHGESLGEHGEYRHSYSVYDATQRVPLILAGAGVPAGRVVREPVRLVDIAPTLLEAVGAPAWPGADGRALQPLLDGGEDAARDAYVETFATRYDYGWSALQGLRDARWKYIRAPRPELYDLAKDPGEREDVAAKRPEVVSELESRLAARLAARPAAAPAPIALDAEERALLGSLGYVAQEPAADDPAGAPLSGPDPKDAIGLLTQLADAERSAVRGQPAQALAALRPIEDPPPAVAALRAAFALAAGEPAQAERDARRAIEREPRRADLRQLLGGAREAQGDAASARAAYEEAARLDPRSVEAWRGIERTAASLGDAGAAERARATADALAQAGAAP